MKKILKYIIIICLLLVLVLITLKLINKDQEKNNKIKDTTKTEIQKEEIKQEKNNYVSYNGNLKIEKNNLLNKNNEVFVLKGISTHGIQWYDQYANLKVIKTLKEEWNTNVFRIAMYTEENGYIYNKDIKNKVMEIVDLATKLDMYVIIDWHILSDGNPNIHKDEAKSFFEEMAKKYRNTPNIIFEICNEPNGNVNWNNDIKPYAEEIITMIRKYSDNIIIVGTGTWSQDILDASNNPINEKNIMYACHFYAGTHTYWLRDRITQAREKGIAIFVSEWGTSRADGNGGVFKEESLKWLKYMKENNISWVNWSLSDKNETSALLLPGTPNDNIDDKYLSESGKFIKEQLKNS